MSARRKKRLGDRLPTPPPNLRTCGVCYLFQQASAGRDNSLGCSAIRHRYLKPNHVLAVGGCPVMMDSCFPQRAFSPGLVEDGVVEVDVSSHSDKKCKFRNKKKRYPIVAYSTDPDHCRSGKLGAFD